MAGFMFATGIENSNPTTDNGRIRQDELEKCGFYRNWQTDFDLVQQIGINYLRYGPPLHRVWLGPDRYDWEFCDLTMNDLMRRSIIPIIDLCHFGVPNWVGDFQNTDFPKLFAKYASEFAVRFPWVQLYTPVNEMYVCAAFSARFGWWNEQLKTERGFVTALKNIVKANVLAMRAILKQRPDAIFIQSESSEYFHADAPAAIGPAQSMNDERFLSLDLNYGHRVNSNMFCFMMDNGMTRAEYDFFLENNTKHHCILGNDYYKTNEHWVASDASTRASGEIFGYHTITEQYFYRYRLPIMHTETNITDNDAGTEASEWLRKQWANVLHVRNSGIPMLGFTWYSLTDQVDWDTALRENNQTVNAVGLFDLDRNIRPVGMAYRNLIKDWKDLLPVQSACMTVPIIPLAEFNSVSYLRFSDEIRKTEAAADGKHPKLRDFSLDHQPV